MVGKTKTIKTSNPRNKPYKKKRQVKPKATEKDKYSFDICYWLDDPVDDEEYQTFFKDHEEDIEWYATDVGPFGSPPERKRVANGYIVKDPDVVLSIVNKTKGHPKLFIDFVHKDKGETIVWSRENDSNVDEESLNEKEKQIRSALQS